MAGDRKVCLTFSGGRFWFSADRLCRRSAGSCRVDGKNRINEFNSLVKVAVSHANKVSKTDYKMSRKMLETFYKSVYK